MINILSSRAKAPSKAFKDPVPRKEGEDNISWLSRNLPTGDVSHIVLVGGNSLSSFRLRLAQAHLRHDLVPSYWSHAFLLRPSKSLAGSSIIEISLEPEKGFAFPTPTNAVQTGKLTSYRDPVRYPNIAVLGVPVAPAEVTNALVRFQMQRAVLDAVDLVVKWLAYSWGVSRSGNPLMDGQGIPSSAMLETVFGAAGFDLTPGLESRSSCPEAIWQAAKWWHEYYERDNRPRITGAFFTPDLIYDEPVNKKP
jgi:hypothetical protein